MENTSCCYRSRKATAPKSLYGGTPPARFFQPDNWDNISTSRKRRLWAYLPSLLSASTDVDTGRPSVITHVIQRPSQARNSQPPWQLPLQIGAGLSIARVCTCNCLLICLLDCTRVQFKDCAPTRSAALRTAAP